MKVYVVTNGDDVIMGIFRKKRKARHLAREVGMKRWGEAWKVKTMVLGLVDPLMLLGGEAFRATKKGQRLAREIVGTHT